jgi:hypothetical protein
VRIFAERACPEATVLELVELRDEVLAVLRKASPT